MQKGFVFIDSQVFRREFPPVDAEVLPGVPWGAIESFPSPAYWAYQAWANSIQPKPLDYKLGDSLVEEVGACLLGGHGIPAKVGLVAFASLKERGVFQGDVPSETLLHRWLSEPLSIDGKNVRYRFARQKARYLHAALTKLACEEPPLQSGAALRNWLLAVPGIGYKTASWIARNWLDADDIAILDIHIMRAGALAGFLTPGLSVERDYLRLEQEFLALGRGIGVRSSILDALIWYQMMSASNIVHGLLKQSGLKAA